MARPKKKGVDYFPHDASHGKTIFVLEQRFGNDGYACWFKLLEALSLEEGHYLDLSDEATELHLAAKCRVEIDTLRDILRALATMGAISSELWYKAKVVWSQNFVNRIADAYRLRKDSLPTFPSQFIVSSEETTDLCVLPSEKTVENGELMQQRERERESKEEIKEEKKKGNGSRFYPPSVDEVRDYCRERGNRVDPGAFIDFYESKGWMVGKNKMKDWRAAVRTWEKRGITGGGPVVLGREQQRRERNAIAAREFVEELNGSHRR